MNPGSKSVFITVLSALGFLAAADAGHRAEDSIQELWLAAEHVCREIHGIEEPAVTLQGEFAIPAAAQWAREPSSPDCESR